MRSNLFSSYSVSYRTLSINCEIIQWNDEWLVKSQCKTVSFSSWSQSCKMFLQPSQSSGHLRRMCSLLSIKRFWSFDISMKEGSHSEQLVLRRKLFMSFLTVENSFSQNIYSCDSELWFHLKFFWFYENRLISWPAVTSSSKLEQITPLDLKSELILSWMKLAEFFFKWNEFSNTKKYLNMEACAERTRWSTKVIIKYFNWHVVSVHQSPWRSKDYQDLYIFWVYLSKSGVFWWKNKSANWGWMHHGCFRAWFPCHSGFHGELRFIIDLWAEIFTRLQSVIPELKEVKACFRKWPLTYQIKSNVFI